MGSLRCSVSCLGSPCLAPLGRSPLSAGKTLYAGISACSGAEPCPGGCLHHLQLHSSSFPAVCSTSEHSSVFFFFFLIAGRLGLEAKVPQALREGDTRVLQQVLLQPHCQRPWPRGDPIRHLGHGVMLGHSPTVAAPVPLRLGHGRAGQVALFPAIATHSHLLHTRCTTGVPDELLLAPKIQVGRLWCAPNNQAETIPPAAHCRRKGRWMVLQPRAPPAPGDAGAPFLAPKEQGGGGTAPEAAAGWRAEL